MGNTSFSHFDAPGIKGLIIKMLKGFHLAPSLKIITNTQTTTNRKQKNFIRQNQVQPNSGLWLPDYYISTFERRHYIPCIWKIGVYTVYPKKYAHSFCFAVLCCGYTLTDFPISIRLTSLALWQSNDCPSASKATLMNVDKYFMWIHYEQLLNHNKTKHNKTVCIFLEIYCNCFISKQPIVPCPPPTDCHPPPTV